jgi:hypothetical protein
MATASQPLLTDEPGIRFGVANGLLVAVILAAGLARLEVDETEFLAVAVAGLASCGLTVLMTTWIGVVAWALFTGFVENDYGRLTFDQADLFRLGVFAVCTVSLAVLARRIHVVVRDHP